MRHLTSALPGARRLSLVAATVAVAVALAACSSSAVSTASPASSTAAASSAGPLSLTGTTWVLLKYVSPDAAVFTVPAAVTPTASFTADQMSGYSGCNQFNGPYTLSGTAFKAGPLVTTKVACGDPMDQVEAAYMAALGVVDSAALLTDGNLQLWDSGGKTTLIFVKGS